MKSAYFKLIQQACLSVFILLVSALCWAKPYAYPVPFVQRNPDHTKIYFRDLPGAGTVRVITITGDEVISLPIPVGVGQIEWNVRNSSGKPIATGVYFYEVEAAGQQTVGKLVVIR